MRSTFKCDRKLSNILCKRLMIFGFKLKPSPQVLVSFSHGTIFNYFQISSLLVVLIRIIPQIINKSRLRSPEKRWNIVSSKYPESSSVSERVRRSWRTSCEPVNLWVWMARGSTWVPRVSWPWSRSAPWEDEWSSLMSRQHQPSWHRAGCRSYWNLSI